VVQKRTTKGYFVFDALQPYPKKMIFTSEESLKKAKLRYMAVIAVLIFLGFRLHFYVRTGSPPDWVFPEGALACLLSPLVIIPFVYFIMPEKILYEPSEHGDIEK
jgi:peptidoglycan/LPS O-acetylase OafA/YrhL